MTARGSATAWITGSAITVIATTTSAGIPTVSLVGNGYPVVLLIRHFMHTGLLGTPQQARQQAWVMSQICLIHTILFVKFGAASAFSVCWPVLLSWSSFIGRLPGCYAISRWYVHLNMSCCAGYWLALVLQCWRHLCKARGIVLFWSRILRSVSGY